MGGQAGKAGEGVKKITNTSESLHHLQESLPLPVVLFSHKLDFFSYPPILPILSFVILLYKEKNFSAEIHVCLLVCVCCGVCVCVPPLCAGTSHGYHELMSSI